MVCWRVTKRTGGAAHGVLIMDIIHLNSIQLLRELGGLLSPPPS